MKFEIKARFTSATLFTAEIDAKFDSAPEPVKLGEAVKVAYLGGADLGGADLRGAYLGGADLRGADLRGAYLGGADLRGAYLGGAYLGGADLRGAYLGGAYLGENQTLKLKNKHSLLQIGSLGSRNDYLIFFDTGAGPYVRAGCFFDTLEKFQEAVETTHKNSNYAKEYAAAVVMAVAYFEIWKDAE